MKFIQGHNRTQINLFPVSLDQSIDPENEVRMIDLFVGSLSIKDYRFRMDFIENGRPAGKARSLDHFWPEFIDHQRRCYILVFQ